ncbi:uncharacterized protein [Spinacia oleracea]|uniref:Uncharacterized protein n=1 Tax=Spinacia oleracea TaxID=3562 RepID=A0ABM3QR51_SPIOL|nr:uncharacterized protein LOC130461670 [Spinacia oleracea]
MVNTRRARRPSPIRHPSPTQSPSQGRSSASRHVDDRSRHGPVLSSRHDHVLESIHASDPQPHGEVEGPLPVTQEYLRRLAEQFNDTLERSLRAAVLNLRDGNEGPSRPRGQPRSTLSTRGPPRSERDHEPLLNLPRHPGEHRASRSLPPPPQRHGRSDARNVIVRRRLRRGELDAREIINSRRTEGRQGDAEGISARSQHESSRRSLDHPRHSLTLVETPRSRHGSSRERDQEENSITSGRRADRHTRTEREPPRTGRREPTPPRDVVQLGNLSFLSPFSRQIIEAPTPNKVKVPSIDPYDGTSDPNDHMDAYKA